VLCSNWIETMHDRHVALFRTQNSIYEYQLLKNSSLKTSIQPWSVPITRSEIRQNKKDGSSGRYKQPTKCNSYMSYVTWLTHKRNTSNTIRSFSTRIMIVGYSQIKTWFGTDCSHIWWSVGCILLAQPSNARNKNAVFTGKVYIQDYLLRL